MTEITRGYGRATASSPGQLFLQFANTYKG